MAWELDPDVALQTRLSLGRNAVLGGAIVLAGMVLALTATGAPRPLALALIAGVTLGALVVALPFAAIHVLTLDRDGRLDQQRLSGRSDVTLAVALLGGASWILILFGVPAFLLSRSLGMGPMQVAALVVGAAATANLLLVLRRASGAESWLLAVFAIVFTISSSLTVAWLPSAAMIALVGGVIVWTSTVPFVLRRMRRPLVPVPRRRGNVVRPWVRMGTARLPEFSRAILSDANIGGMLIIGAAMPLLMVLVQMRNTSEHDRMELTQLLLYVPLMIAGLEASNRIRRERTSRAIERISLSGQSRWAVVVQLAAAYSLPFAIASIAAVIPLAWLHPREMGVLVPWPLAAVALVFTGLAEGLRGRRVAAYVVPAAFVAVLASSGDHGATWWVIFGVCWIPLVMAAECLERPEDAPIRGWLAPLAAAALGAAITSVMYNGGGYYFRQSIPLVAGWMALAAGLLLPDHAPLVTPRRLVAAAMACGLAAGLTEYYAIAPAMRAFVLKTAPSTPILWPSTVSLIIGALAAAGLAYGWLAHNRFGATSKASLISRSIPIGVAFALSTAMELLAVRATITPLLGEHSYAAFRIATALVFLGLLLIAIAAVLLLPRSKRHARHQS